MRRAILTGITALLLLLPIAAHAMEKWWPAHEAELIVVGTLHSPRSCLWFDGWRIEGTIDVRQVLYGNASRALDLRMNACEQWRDCDWRSLWTAWRHGSYLSHLQEPGIWFVKRGRGGVWIPSAGWTGYADISERAAYEDYIRRYKR